MIAVDGKEMYENLKAVAGRFFFHETNTLRRCCCSRRGLCISSLICFYKNVKRFLKHPLICRLESVPLFSLKTDPSIL